jgi:hypothetical protein
MEQLQALTGAITIVGSIVAIADKTKNSELKNMAADLRLQLSDAKDVIYKLQGEIRTLKNECEKLKEDKSRPLEWRNALYWIEGDPVPFCPDCYEKDKSRYHLSPYSPIAGAIAYRCFHCNSYHSPYNP